MVEITAESTMEQTMKLTMELTQKAQIEQELQKLQKHKLENDISIVKKVINKSQQDNIEFNGFLDLQQMIAQQNDKNKLQTSVLAEIIQKVKIHNDKFYYLQPLRITTQTLVFELSMIYFNDFRVDMDELQIKIKNAQQQGLIPENLLEMKSKRFEIQFGQNVKYDHQYISKIEEMNSSINFVFRSLKNSQKIYKLRLFRNGMLQIPGVIELFEFSEVTIIINQLIQFYKYLFDSSHNIQILNQYAAMTNFISKINIQENQRLDFIRIVQYVQTNNNILQSIEQETGVQCIHFDISTRRIVLYIKLLIPKQKFEYTKYKAQSTSNRKIFSSITALITQKGIVLLQGCPENYNITNNVLHCFELIIQRIFKDFIITPTFL